MTRSVGKREAGSDLHQCGAGFALHRDAARLHAEVAHYDLRDRRRGTRRPHGVGRCVVVLDPAMPCTRTLQMLCDGGFHEVLRVLGCDVGCGQAASGTRAPGEVDSAATAGEGATGAATSNAPDSRSAVRSKTTASRRVLFNSRRVTSGRE